MTNRTVRANVTGRVQGVWFRAWTKQEAERLGLAGWVRNEADGSVTSLIAGPEAQVNEMLSLLWQGPPAARVDKVTTEEATIEDGGSEAPPPGFTIVR